MIRCGALSLRGAKRLIGQAGGHARQSGSVPRLGLPRRFASRNDIENVPRNDDWGGA
jgi:hypothetical protein